MTHWPVFDELGESQVRMQFVDFKDDVETQAREWLRLKEEVRTEASAAKRDAREEETLSIARSALASARRANKIAITAAILAAAATIIAAIIGVMYVSPK